MRPLTRVEQAFAEDHAYVVTSFLRRKGLDPDEYFDVIIFGFLRAVVNYHDRPELQQYSFYTIAFKAMLSDYGNERRRNNALKRRAAVISLDSPAAADSETDFHELIADPIDAYADVFSDETVSLIKRSLPKRQYETLRLKSAGLRESEIARIQGTTSGRVRHMLWLARKKVHTDAILTKELSYAYQ